jgi:putative thiamine transport system permease protein
VRWIERGLIALLAFPVLGLVWQAIGGMSQASPFAGWQFLFAEPALVQSIGLSVSVAMASLAGALWLSRLLSFYLLQNSDRVRLQAVMLSIPHSAFALGVLLYFGANGVLIRWLASTWPELASVDYLFPRDLFGLGALLVLILKESVFLTLLAIPLAKRLPLDASFRLAKESGWSDWSAWRILIWPQLRRLLHAPILVVFAFSMTNLEVAVILGSDQVPFYAVRALRWLLDPDPIAQQAGASAVLGMLLALMIISRMLLACDRGLRHAVPKRIHTHAWCLRGLSHSVGLILMAAVTGLALWAVAGYWPVTAAWPTLNATSVARLVSDVDVWWTTLWIGLLVATLAIGLSVVWLEWMVARRITHLSWVWWALLWMPSLPLSAGLLGWIYVLGLSPGPLAVILGHLLLAWPYTLVVLSDAWLHRPESERILVAQSGLSQWSALWHVWLPKHSVSVLAAFAVAFAVSLSLYTQTLLLGGGRVETLITELVVNLSGDRRSAASFALLNTVMPWIVFMITAWIGRRLWRHRRGMQGGVHATTS